MDREILKGLASGRRNPTSPLPVPETRKVVWKCEYCEHPFASERVFMNHRCREKERIDELRSHVGQSAYAYYALWMKQCGRSVPPIETFSHSSLYTTFVKFAKHAVKVNMPNIPGFIKTMVENGNVQPSLWCRDNVYALYLAGYDKVVDPVKQYVDSLGLLQELAKDYEVPVGEVFKELGVDKILALVQKRKLSSWLLITSSKFREYMGNQSEWDKNRLESVVQVGAMIMRVQQNPESIAHFKTFSKANAEEGL